MSNLTISIDRELLDVLQAMDDSAEEAARDLIILELYRRGSISSGKATEWTGRSRHEFIQYASRLGIPSIDLSEEELNAERIAGDR